MAIFDTDLHGGGSAGIWLSDHFPGTRNDVESILIDEDRLKMPTDAVETGLQVFYSVEMGCEEQSEDGRAILTVRKLSGNSGLGTAKPSSVAVGTHTRPIGRGWGSSNQ